MHTEMNNPDYSFNPMAHFAFQESHQDRLQHEQPVKTNAYPENGRFEGQHAVMANMNFRSTNATSTNAAPNSDTTQYSLSTLFGNDMNGFQNIQWTGPESSGMTAPQQQHIHQHIQQQPLPELQQPQQQQQLNFQPFNAELFRSLSQMPGMDHQLRSRLFPAPQEPIPQFQRFDDAHQRCFMPQGNHGMNNMTQLNLLLHQQQQQQQPFTLPSPHELTLRDDTRRMRGGVIEPFPEKLHRLLMEVEAVGRSDVISFIAGGKAFAIHKPDKFFNEIVPQYFRQSRLSSFKRQLNLYGFELINTGPTRGGYYHEMFVKDHPELCRRMRRVAIKLQMNNKPQEGEQKADDFCNAFPIAAVNIGNLHQLEQVVPRAG